MEYLVLPHIRELFKCMTNVNSYLSCLLHDNEFTQSKEKGRILLERSLLHGYLLITDILNYSSDK